MSPAWAMATQIAAPTTTETVMVVLVLTPLATKIRMVTAISVMPLKGDQLVRPRHSLTITPAIQIHSVPSNAMATARPQPISGATK